MFSTPAAWHHTWELTKHPGKEIILRVTAWEFFVFVTFYFHLINNA